MRVRYPLQNQLILLFLLWLHISVAFALPSLGTGRMIDGAGQFSTTTTTFTGGAALNGVNHQANVTVNSDVVVNLQGSIQVSPSDVGKQADLLVVVGVEPNEPFDGGVDTVYRTIDEFGERSTVDLYNAPTVWLNQLAEHPFKRNVTLTSEVSVDIGTLIPETVKNVSYIFIGYRLADGSIIYSSTPIIVTNTPPNSATSSFAPIQISHVTSPSTELGLIVTNGKESMGIFGKKDSQGRLTTIDRLSLTSLTDSKSVVITLDANHLPRTMETSDGYKVQFGNYSSNGATGTIQRPDGIIENQSFLPIPYNDIMEAVDTIQQYEGSPQPTENSDIPSSSSTGSTTTSSDDCKKKVGELCRQVENLVWGVSQIVSIVACGAAGASAVASGGVAVPLAIWACGSVVLNGIAKLEEPIKKGSCDGGSTETCPIGGEGSCLQHLNNANSMLSDVQACAAPPSVSGCAQAVGLRLVDGAVKSLLDPEKVCAKTNVNVCPLLKDVCNSYKGDYYNAYDYGLSCTCTAWKSRLPSDKLIESFKQDCLTVGNTKWESLVGGIVQKCCSSPDDGGSGCPII
jgi:hypothetical protein